LFKTYCRDLREGGMHFPTQNAEVTRLLLADLKNCLSELIHSASSPLELENALFYRRSGSL
jgi:hypothetical protein